VLSTVSAIPQGVDIRASLMPRGTALGWGRHAALRADSILGK
jgi:hypothetical protein